MTLANVFRFGDRICRAGKEEEAGGNRPQEGRSSCPYGGGLQG